MAIENEIKIGMTVSSNGTTERELKQVKALKAAYDEAATSAGKMGGTAGSRAAAASSMSGTQYNVAKGVGGTSARDFADEARGLGGLVRAYATFAANIFAVSAAFTALKEAAQTDNLIKGLDTLGASSGRSLGSLSKRLVEATDGAISLRDAMTATAQASAAGMSSKNLERLAVVAKNASTALGVSMTDALSRLSRGITKLEPELLDELGLFTKIGPATEKYALQIGKSVSQLTDLEKRQAFANAVLEEGEQKFNSLSSSSANAYDKLLSTAKNATQEILSSVNVILEPIAKFLANNPVIVAAGTIGIASTLLKRAIPDLLGDYSKLQAANEKALEAQKKSLDGSKQLQAQLLAEKLAAEDLAKSASKIADARLSQADAADAQAAASKIKQSKTRASKLDEILGTTPYEDVSKEQIAALEEQSKKFEGKNKKAAESYAILAKSITEYQAALSRETLAQEALTSSTTKLAEAQARLKAIEVDIAATQAALQLSNARLAASNILQERGIFGLITAVKALNTELKLLGATTGQRFGEIAKFTGGALLGGLGKLLTGLNWATAAWTALTLVVDLGSAIFSKNAKEMEAFSKATQAAADSADNASRTVEALTKKGGFASASIDGIAAMTNAFTELADAASTAVAAAAKAQRSLDLSWWDKLSNSISKLFGKDIASKEADTLGAQIENAGKIMSRVAGGDEASAKLKSMLGVTSLDAERASEAFKKLDDISKGKVVAFLKEFSSELGNTSQRLNNFKSSTDTAYKAYQEFIQSTALNNPLLKLGQTLEVVAKSMSDIFSLGSSSDMLSAMDELVKNSEKAALFGPKFVEGLVSIRTSFKDTTKEVKGLQDAQADVTAEIQKQQAVIDDQIKKHPQLADPKNRADATPQFMKAREQLELLQERQRELNKGLNVSSAKADAVFKTATDLFVQGLNDAFKTGAQNIVTALGNVQEKAALALSRAQAGGLSGENQARRIAELNQQDFKIQERAIDTNIKLIASQEQLTATINESNALTAQANLPQDASQKAKDNAASAVAAAQAYKQFVTAKGVDTSQAGITAFANSKELDAFASALFKSMALSFSSKLAGQQAAKVEVRGKAAAQAETDRQATESGRYADLAKINQQEQQILSAKIQQKSVLDAMAGITSQEIILAQQKLDIEAIDKRQKLELEEIGSRRIKAGSDKTELAKLDEEEKRIKERQKLEKDTLGLQSRQKLLTLELDLINKQFEVTKSNSELEKNVALARLDYESQNLSLMSSAYDITKQYTITKQTQLEKEKALVETTAAMQQAQDALNQKRAEGEARIEAMGGDRTSAGAKAILDEIARQEVLTNNTIAGLSAQYKSKVAILDKTKEINLEQEKYNQILSLSTSLADSLKGAFGAVGEKIGGLTTALAEVAVQSEKNAKALAEVAQERAKAYKEDDKSEKSKKRIADAEESYGEQLRKNQRDELAGNIKVVASAKNLFKEKTFAYKALDKVEKAMHIAKLAMDAKELAIKLGFLATGTAAKAGAEAAETGLTFAGVVSRLPAYAAEIYGKTIGQLGPIAGPVVATALVAAMFAALGKGGGRASSPAVPTSAMNQETQGTGTAWVRDQQGNLVKSDTAGGVFGDNAAKVDSINKSLEIMKNGIIDGLDYDSRMLRAMERVADAITGAAKAVYTIPGLRKGGTGFGTLAGSSTEKNWYQDIPLIGGALGSIFGGGTSVNTSIEGAGIQLRGTFEQVMQDTTDSILQYKDILQHFHEDGGWFGSDDDWNVRFRQTAALQKEVSSAISDIFGSAKEMFTNVADMAGISSTTVSTAFKTMSANVDIDLMGLTGDQVVSELNAVIGAKLNTVAEAIFGKIFDQFKKFGEGYLETVVRVVDGNQKVQKALEYMGNTTGKVSFAVSEAAISLAKDVNTFVDQAKYFAENFLTDQERLVVLQKNLGSQLTSLGLSSKLTKTEFRNLVQAQNLNTAAGREMYQSLMDLAPAFMQVQDLLDSTISDAVSKLGDLASTFKDLAKSFAAFKSNLLLGASSYLSPQDKYALSRATLQSTYASAMSGDKTAMASLQGDISAFLEASKTLYASSSQYVADFSDVMTMLDNAQITAQSQADLAQSQLTALQNHTLYLENIDKGIAKLAGIPTAARGGYKSGLTLVGELGPELVDFSTPARVYTADQTAGMFSMPRQNTQQQLIAEISELKQEVVKLREQQRAETGHLINATYDAQGKNAEAVTEGIDSSLTKQAWADKVRNSAMIG